MLSFLPKQAVAQSEPRESGKGRAGRRGWRLAERNVAQAAVGTFEDAREVAGRLAALLDIAHQERSTEVDLPLVGAYNSVKERRKIYGELVRIARLVRNRLPHHAAGVTRVNVYFGAKMVLRIPLDANQ